MRVVGGNSRDKSYISRCGLIGTASDRYLSSSSSTKRRAIGGIGCSLRRSSSRRRSLLCKGVIVPLLAGAGRPSLRRFVTRRLNGITGKCLGRLCSGGGRGAAAAGGRAAGGRAGGRAGGPGGL